VKDKRNECVLEVKNIDKRFPGVQALNDVSIALRKGEVHAVIGENGAGKSTLMNIIFGLIHADRGKIFRNGQEVVIDSPIDAQRIGIGIVPQELSLVPLLTVMENIQLGMMPCKLGSLKVDWKEMERKAMRALSEVGERIDPRMNISRLSIAHQQLVQIARALSFGAEILIFDEPTASLTLKETETLFTVIKRFKEKGGSVFYISHRLEELKEVSDRITVLRDGEKVAELIPEKTDMKEMIRYMVGREIIEVEKRSDVDYGQREVLLKVERLSRAGEFQNISFELREGEILGFAGLVGAGRTELAKCIFGETIPDSGEVNLFSKKTVHHTPNDAIRNRLAYVPEERRKLGIFPLMSVSENMSMPVLRKLTRFFKISGKRETALVREYIKKLDIRTPSIRQRIQNLSGGNQQKVILARWLLTGCRILILDEPTRGIDVNAKAEIHQLLRQLVKEGISVLFISSELKEVIDIADRIIIMHEGDYKGEVIAGETSQEQILQIALS
jgi:ABC-type sugar transport system ATPase subunit